METIVLEYTQVCEQPDLYDFILDLNDLTETDDISDLALQMFASDPDLIRIGGETSHFIDVEVKDVRYVLYTEEIGDIEDVLHNFFSEKYKELFKREEDEWSVYSALDNAIAYRGGKGYCYAIYSF